MVDRHDILVDALYDLAKKARFNPTKHANDVQCLGESSTGIHAFRPADLKIMGDSNDWTCIDITVVSPFADSRKEKREGRIPGAAAFTAANLKDKKHADNCKANGLEFIPFAVDVCGMMDRRAYNLIKRFASKIASIEARPYSYTLSICLRRISLAIQLGTARQLMRLFPNASSTWADDVIGLI